MEAPVTFICTNPAGESKTASKYPSEICAARQVKGVPAKETDVCDAQWLQQLHAAELLRKSFRPALQIMPLCFLMRHCAEMVGDAAKQLQLMQKSQSQMGGYVRRKALEKKAASLDLTLQPAAA